MKHKGALIATMTVVSCFLMAGITLAEEAHKISATPSVVKPRLHEAYGKLPLSFEANQGQLDSQVKFLSRGRGYSLFLTPTGAVLALRKSEGDRGKDNSALARRTERVQATKFIDTAVLRMHLLGANPEPKIAGREELPGKANYFVGNDPAKWRANVPTYARVHYEAIYPGIDLVYYGTQRQLEYDFVVSSGADPKAITLAFEGVDGVAIDALGDLVLRADGSEVRLRKPVVYQQHDGQRAVIPTRYVLKAEGQVAFEVAAYDATRPLIIDPVLVYSTYLGGSEEDDGFGIAVDAAGNAYVTGKTRSTDFPKTPGARQPTFGGGSADAFVTKLDTTKTGPDSLVYSTYLGGNGEDIGYGIAVDADGSAYVTGVTGSTNFPTLGAFQRTFRGDFDAFVTKLDLTGVLLYSTYLGGSGFDEGFGIAVDASGNAYVTGLTVSNLSSTRPGFPTTPGAYQPTFGGGFGNAFVTKLDTTKTGLASLVYSTYLGGAIFDEGFGIAVDAAGNAYVTGETQSTNFPTTPGAFQPTFGGGSADAFVTKLDATGSSLVYSTYLGGSGGEGSPAGAPGSSGIAVDAAGNAYVTGETRSTNFPTTPGALQPTFGGGSADAFVTKLNPTGSALVYSTYLGGSSDDSGAAIAVDASGNAYVTGSTQSSDFPTTVGAFQPGLGGFVDAFVTKLDPTGAALLYSTYLGGSGFDSIIGTGIAQDAAGNAYVTGLTDSSNSLPTTVGAFQAASGGGFDAFVAKLRLFNTLEGENVTVSLGQVTVTFESVTAAGDTTLTTSTTGPLPPAGFNLGDPRTYYNLATTASFSGVVTVCINYNTITFSNVASLKLFSFEDPNWVDANVSPDTATQIICGRVTTLSPFAIFEPETQSVRPFAAFAAKVEIEVERHERELEMKGTFSLGAGSDGIKPLSEDVSFQVGTFSTIVPAGSFRQDRKGRFKFKGAIDGVALEAVIRPLHGGRFKFKAEWKGANLTGMTNPVEVTLTIGNDGGNTIRVKAKHDD